MEYPILVMPFRAVRCGGPCGRRRRLRELPCTGTTGREEPAVAASVRWLPASLASDGSTEQCQRLDQIDFSII